MEHREKEVDYFDDAELERIRTAAATGPHPIRDTMIVSILETTGLRLTGLLNILVSDVAERSEDAGRWVALTSGRTLTKGNKTQSFKAYAAVRNAIERWLNTSEADGGRPRGPGPFLLPSARKDDGRMCEKTMDTIFTDICRRAGFDNDPRTHVHAMRHSFAHALERQGNSVKQISLSLGHKDVKVTSTVYLRDDAEHGCAGMVMPQHWEEGTATARVNSSAQSATSAAIGAEPVASASAPVPPEKKAKVSTKDMWSKMSKIATKM